jgi:ABC-2 type transport system permease protein
MMSLSEAAYVVARRDFTATVFSKTFLIFLLGPIIVIGVTLVVGNIGERMARENLRPNVAVIAGEAEFEAIAAARARLEPVFGEGQLPELVRAEPDYVIEAQVNDLLKARDQRILAVLTGGMDNPRLTGAVSEAGKVRQQVRLIVEEARHQRALAGAGGAAAPVELAFTEVAESAGSLAALRAITARGGQGLLFMVTLLLAGMLLSNFVEEKSNKVIEVLTAAVPVDAIFLGKLMAMLAVSMLGLAVWGAVFILGTIMWPIEGFDLPSPAVGWPIFVLLVLIYYCANYMLLGSLFLGIGSQASSVREVQTLSMPVSIGQVLVFLFATFAVGPYNGLLGIAAAVFPFSSPLVMVARAAQTPELWTHPLAIAWQGLWVWLTLKLAAGLFRRNVLKSGSGGTPASVL